MRGRRGFALIAVLWVVVALGALSAGAVARARVDAAVSGARVARMRGRWAAEACLAVAQGRIDASLNDRGGLAEPPADTLLFANGARCVTTALDPGTRIRRDSAPASLLARFDSALATRGGYDSLARDSLLTSYGDGRINVNAAPPEVLAALPGIGDDALRVVAEARAWNRPVISMDDLAYRLPPHARALLFENFRELAPWVSFQTGGLVLAARGWVDGRAAETIEVLVVNGGNRMAVIRRRMW